MDQYHGTDKITAQEIITNGVDISQGGGELGQGFYTGNYEWEAFNWNWHKHSDKGDVIKFEIAEEPFWNLNIRILTIAEGMPFYRSIKKGAATRTYLFGCDVVWSEFLGFTSKSANAEQLKFETEDAEIFINGLDVKRSLI